MRTKAIILSILVCAISIGTQGQEVMDKVVTLQEVFPFADQKTDYHIAAEPDDNSKMIPLDDGYNPQVRYYDGMAMIEDHGKKGFIDEKGNILKGGFVYEHDHHHTPHFNKGAIIMMDVSSTKRNAYILKKDGTRTLINKWVKYFTGFNNDGIAAIVVVDKNARGGYVDMVKYINTKGQWLYPRIWTKYINKFEGLGNFRNGKALYYDAQAQKYGFINKQGIIIQKPIFVLKSDFSGGIAISQEENGNFSITNEKGEISFSIRGGMYNGLGQCRFGYCPMQKAWGKFVMIDKDGNEVTDTYKMMSPFYPNGLALVSLKNGQFGVLNTDLQIIRVISLPYDEAGSFIDIPYYKGILVLKEKFFDFYGNCYSTAYNYVNVSEDSDLMYVVSNGLRDQAFLNRITGKIVSYFGKNEF